MTPAGEVVERLRAADLTVAAGEALLLLHPDDAAERGIEGGERVRIWNRRGSFFASAKVTEGVRPGVAVSYGVRWARLSEAGMTANDTTDQAESDLGGGAVFYDNAVEVELAPAAAESVISGTSAAVGVA